LISFYLSGKGGITGAGLPPKPVTTSADAGVPNPALLPKPPGVGLEVANVEPVPKLFVGVDTLGAVVVVANPFDNPPAGGVLLNVGLGKPAGVADCPASFSCVRPYALTPSTAHIETWNNPPPCNVIGTH
jgi:hypothetical protein